MTTKRAATVTLPTDTQIMITREFDAPRHLVYRAFTTPELIERWWHANRGKVTSTEVDLRVGGKWRWVMVTPKGFEVAFSGEYRELVPNERLVYTELFEGAPGRPALTTLTLVEEHGRTVLTLLAEHWTRAQRDAVLESGMEDGMQDAFDLMEQVASSIR